MPLSSGCEEPRCLVIIAVDSSDGELRFNRDLNTKIVADAAAPSFPFRDSSVDLVVSRSVVEHMVLPHQGLGVRYFGGSEKTSARPWRRCLSLLGWSRSNRKTLEHFGLRCSFASRSIIASPKPALF
jgi:hypothetical protein